MLLNARSLIRNFDKFTQLLDATQHEFSAIGISETWVNDVNQNYRNITGYRFISSNRADKCGGGAGLLTLLCLMSCLICVFLTLHFFDSVFVEIESPRGKTLIVGTIYRPPKQNLLEFMEYCQPLIEQVTRDNKLCYITDDFNLDLPDSDLPSITNDFINVLFSHALFSLISRPSRITCTSRSMTLIDNIFTNTLFFFIRMLFFQPRLNILIFLPILG